VGILTTDHKSLDGFYISGGRTDISNPEPHCNFDQARMQALLQKAQGCLGDFGGALRNAVGQTKFADLSELINAGGAVQGANQRQQPDRWCGCSAAT
jgi:hypothetical protein